jgi:sugar phosphate isomerase/epimerase
MYVSSGVRPALSTVFMHASTAPLGPSEALEVFLRAEAGGVLLDSGLPRDLMEALTRELAQRGDDLPVVALEAPCPRTVRPGAIEPELCAAERDEARAALDAAVATVRRAGELRASFVVVRLGAVQPVARDWIFARDRFLRGDLGDDVARRMQQARDAAAERAIDNAARALDRLAREAEVAGVTVLVRNGRRYIDVPTARELDRLRAELRGAPLAPLLDVPAAHLADVMGFQPLALTLAAWSPAPLCYFGDACGPVGGLAPGRGIVDLAAVRAALAEGTRMAFNPWPGLTVDEIIEAVARI